MKSTSWRFLVAVAASAALFGWVLMRVVDVVLARYLPVPWTAAGAMWLLALALFAWTLNVRRRIRPEPGVERLEPVVAARTVALAFASSRTGAAIGGLYLGICVGFLGELAVPAGVQNAISSAVAMVGSLAVVVIALWLECICRVDDDPDGDVLPSSDSLRE